MFMISKHGYRQFLYIMISIVMNVNQPLAYGLGINNPVTDLSAIMYISVVLSDGKNLEVSKRKRKREDFMKWLQQLIR